jgi:hypothetical protein
MPLRALTSYPRLLSLAAGIAFLLSGGGLVQAAIIELEATLTGDQEVPPVATEASGTATIAFDPETRLFDLDLFVIGIGLDDLAGAGPNDTPVHIHRGPPGVNGPIIVDLGFMSDFFEDEGGLRLVISGELLGGQQGELFTAPAGNAAVMLAGNTYINVHTQAFPAGEIRGQIISAQVPPPTPIPLPGSALLLGLGLVGMAWARREY